MATNQLAEIYYRLACKGMRLSTRCCLLCAHMWHSPGRARQINHSVHAGKEACEQDIIATMTAKPISRYESTDWLGICSVYLSLHWKTC